MNDFLISLYLKPSPFPGRWVTATVRLWARTKQEEASASISCGGVASYKSVRSSIDGMPEQELPITANGCYKEKEKTKN